MTKYLLLLPALTGCIIVEGEKSDRATGTSGIQAGMNLTGKISENEDDWEGEESTEDTWTRKMSMEHIIQFLVKPLQEMYFYRLSGQMMSSIGLRL